MENNDIFSYIKAKEDAEKGKFEYTYLKDLSNRRFTKTKRALDLLSKIFKKRKKAEVIIIHGSKFMGSILLLNEKYNIIVLNPQLKDRIKLISNGIETMSTCKWDYELSESYKEFKLYNKENLLNAVLKEIDKYLNGKKCSLVIFGFDGLFLERAITKVAKENKIPTITIQHGLFQFVKPHINDGYFTDYFFTWGHYFKENYIKFGIQKEDKIKIIGYPFYTNNKRRFNLSKDIKVLYLGTISTNDEIRIESYKIANMINHVCQRLDIEFCYRIHPGEDLNRIKDYCTQINKFSCKNSLLQDFDAYDVIIGINSTAIVEATINNKIAVEMINKKFISNKYYEMGIAYKCECNENDLYDFFEQCKMNKIKPKINNQQYVYINENFNDDFLYEVRKVINSI
ncbi:hypothetical protein [Clostridium beijerinckii]|uniref:hypothetical protein n=1 Tax=Clostridium beijerinckii TaxID=1520 RepID=UPI002330D0AB|nr:hypothetical protein [Clostridium beijerinckii]